MLCLQTLNALYCLNPSQEFSTPMKPIQLLVVDDHTLFRRGLIALLLQDGRFEVVAQAADIGQALRCVELGVPDLILLDNHLPGVRGVDGIGALRPPFRAHRS